MFTPLEGVHILDLTRLLPGPFCTWMLQALGAQVLRLDAPGNSDYSRLWPPVVGRHGALYHQLNRGKQSIIVDLRQERGREVFEALVDRHDVLVEGFRPGKLAGLGADPERLLRDHPRLILCSISGYGQDGPRAPRAGHSLNYEALAGMLWLSGERDGPPRIPAVPLADLCGACQAALAITAALYERERTGRGSRIDISLSEAAAAMTAPMNALRGFADDSDRGRGMLNGGLACYNIYRTADGGYLAIAALEPRFWAEVCEVLGHPEWASLPPLVGPQQESVERGVAEVVERRTRAEWEEIFRERDVCVEPVLSPGEVVADAHHRSRGVVEGEGETRWIRPPLGRPVAGDSPEPGEHTDAVLAELGYGEEEVVVLREQGVVV